MLTKNNFRRLLYKLKSIVEGSQGRHSSENPRWESGGQELKQRPWRNTYWLAQFAFVYTQGPPAQRCPSLHTSITNQKNTPRDMPTDQSHRGNSFVAVPSSQMTIVYVDKS